MRLPDNQDIIFDSENKLGFPEMSAYTGQVNIKDLGGLTYAYIDRYFILYDSAYNFCS